MRVIICLTFFVITCHVGEIWSDTPSWDDYVQQSEKLQQTGQYMEAFAVIKQGLEVEERDAGMYAKAMQKAENLLDKAGRLEVALPFIMSVHERWLKEYGTDSIPVGLSLKLLAQVYSKLGDTNNALHYGQLLLKNARNGTGEERLSSIAIAKYMLAGAYMDKHQYALAKKLYKQAAIHFQHAKNDDYSAQIGACYNSLGILASYEGKHQQALTYYKKSLDLPSDNPDEVDSTLYNLGSLYMRLGELQQAKKIFIPLLFRTEKIYGSQHLNTAEVHNQLGLIAYKEENYEQALQHFQKLYDVASQRPEERRSSLASALVNISNVYQAKSQYKKAEEYLKRAYLIRSKTTDTRAQARTLDLLGIASSEKGDLSQAIKYHKQAIHILKKNKDTRHPYYADALSQLGMVRLQKGQYSVAKACFHRAIEIKEKISSDSMSLATTLADIGTAYVKQKQYKEAEDFLLRAVDIQRKVGGPNHVYLADTYNNLAILYSQLQQYEQALQCSQDAVKIAREALGPSHASTKLYKQNLLAFKLRKILKI